jgi:RNA polymerase sigma-70 factor (ECF subfamily)
LFDTHHKIIHAYCLRRLAVEDANDAISEVFLVAWRRIDEIPDGDETLMWLYGVARNVVRNRQRASRRQIRLVARTGSLAVEPREGLETIVIRNEEHAEVLRAMETLKESDQDLLYLKVWEDLSNTAIGAILGISHRAVEGRYARALKRLSKQLERGHSVARRSPISVEKGEATT